MMKLCPKCGSQNVDENTSCDVCGNLLGKRTSRLSQLLSGSDTSQPEAAQPDWLTSLDAPKTESSEESEPDWITKLGAPKVEQPSATQPDWLTSLDAPKIESSEESQPDWMNAFDEADNAKPEASQPNWLAELGTPKSNNERLLNVFLCHSSRDKPVVRRLYRQLGKEKWIDPWLDEEKLDPGDRWNFEIRRAVRNSDIVIVCISNSSINKEGFIQKEIRFALDVADEKPEGTIFIIPLKLEECTVPDRLSEWQWVNYYEQGAYGRLMRSLRKRAITLGITVE